MSNAQGVDGAMFSIFLYIFLLSIYFYLFFISYLEVYRNYILCIGDLKPLSCKAFERIPSVHICIRIHPNPTSGVAFSGDFGAEDKQRVWLFACVSLFSANFRCSGCRLCDINYTRSVDESPPFHIENAAEGNGIVLAHGIHSLLSIGTFCASLHQ